MNYDRSKSYVKMPSKEVARLAQETIDWVKAKREEEKKEWIEECRVSLTEKMQSRLCWWLRRDPTEEEVMFEANGGGDCWVRSELEWIDYRYSKAVSIAKDLLVATEHADEIYVCVEELRAIGG